MPEGPKSGLKLVIFCDFIKFNSLVFFEIAYSDSLQQCFTSSGGKDHEKDFWAKFGSKRTKARPKISFFAIFSSLVHYFSFKLHRMIKYVTTWDNF